MFMRCLNEPSSACAFCPMLRPISTWSSVRCDFQFLTRVHLAVLDGPGSFDDEDRRRPVRKERDDKVHDSIIEERIQRERPCRTLFIRNIKASPIFNFNLCTCLSIVRGILPTLKSFILRTSVN